MKTEVYLKDIACCIAEDMETTGYAPNADDVLRDLEYRFAQSDCTTSSA